MTETRSIGKRRRVTLVIISLIVVFPGILIIDHHLRWKIWMRINGVLQIDQLLLNLTGYTIERLPFSLSTSFARGNNVYFVHGDGRVYKGRGRNRPDEILQIGDSQIRPRMLFVSSRGTEFDSKEATTAAWRLCVPILLSYFHYAEKGKWTQKTRCFRMVGRPAAQLPVKGGGN